METPKQKEKTSRLVSFQSYISKRRKRHPAMSQQQRQHPNNSKQHGASAKIGTCSFAPGGAGDLQLGTVFLGSIKLFDLFHARFWGWKGI